MNAPARTLAWLWTLGLATALLARLAPPGAPWAGIAFLALAGWKARHVLNGYLGLAPSRFWHRAFTAFTAAFLVLAAAIYLLPLAG